MRNGTFLNLYEDKVIFSQQCFGRWENAKYFPVTGKYLKTNLHVLQFVQLIIWGSWAECYCISLLGRGGVRSMGSTVAYLLRTHGRRCEILRSRHQILWTAGRQ